jgi:hypothetical protein
MFNVVTDPEAQNVPMLVVFSNDKKKKHLDAKELSELLLHEQNHPHPTLSQQDDVAGDDLDDDVDGEIDESLPDDDYGDDDAAYDDDYDSTTSARDENDDDEETDKDGEEIVTRQVAAASRVKRNADNSSNNNTSHDKSLDNSESKWQDSRQSDSVAVSRKKRSALLDYNRRHYEALDMQRKMLDVGGTAAGAKDDVIIPSNMHVISVRANGTAADVARGQGQQKVVRTGKRKNKGRRGRKNMCRRRSLYVNFEDIHWNNWIIAPRGYQVRYQNHA